MSTPAANTRSANKECRKCDFCLIKKELTKLNQMIVCPAKAMSKRLLEEADCEGKKLAKKALEDLSKAVEDVIKEEGEALATTLT
jgi:vacuolar-type H+-ATPase subunit H